MFSSCSGQSATRKEAEAAFKKATYDSLLIKDINKYTVLKDFLVDNLDTITTYRNRNNKVSFIGANAHVDSIRQVDEPCWLFTVARGPYDITHVPEFTRSKLDGLIKGLGEDRLANFTICDDKTLTFNVRFVGNPGVNNLKVLHKLTWNKVASNADGYDFVKATPLEDKWTYNICVFRNQGW